ncbi:hypothetical protein V3F56_14070, partial [Moorellaceae bacterium AZ2]
LSQALVWPAGEAFASESQAGLGSKLGMRHGNTLRSSGGLTLTGMVRPVSACLGRQREGAS